MSLRAKPLTAEQALRRRCQRMLADQRRRARRDGVQLQYGLDDLLALVRAATVCHYCTTSLALDLQLDHKKPIVRGGTHSLDNLAPCCKRCNVFKGRLMGSEYLQLLALLGNMAPAGQDDLRRRLIAGGRVYAGTRRPKGA